ncbi:MAG: extracellular solute-binding protein, partial [Clostridiales bacterium]|nr:extracellular solute-binding protein [Clostridiales bacterium]
CGQGAEVEDETPSSKPTTGTEDNVGDNNDSQEEPVTLTMIQRLNAEFVVEDNPIIEELGKRLNINLEMEAPPINNYADRLNIVMASGELPDIIFLNNMAVLYQDWAEDGLLLQLDEYFESSMPNAKAVLTEQELTYVQIASLDNGMYSVPRVQTKDYDVIIYRKDWLDKLQLEVPQTPEEFANVMLAFSKEDPDGNGADDTFGWSYNRVFGHLYRNITSGFEFRPATVPDENGNYEIMQAQEGYMVYVDWLRDMYLNGAMDPEWYLTKMYEDDDKFVAAKSGAIYNQKTVNHIVAAAITEVKNVDPNAELVLGPPLRKEGDASSNVYYNPQMWGNYAINAESANIEKAIEFLDYGYTNECNELLNLGIEGLTYTSFDPETRIASLTEEQSKAASQYTSAYATMNYQTVDKRKLMNAFISVEDQKIYEEANADIGAKTNQVIYLPTSLVAGTNEALVKITDSGIITKYDEYETKYICDQISREDFVNFIENEYVPAHEEYMNIIRESGINK